MSSPRIPAPIAEWHRIAASGDAAALDKLLAHDAVFHSPVVRTPQRGKAITQRYLAAAFGVFGGPDFRYVREVIGERDAVLARDAVEFGATYVATDELGRDQMLSLAKRLLPSISVDQCYDDRLPIMSDACAGGTQAPGVDV
jgi:ketosteroid isomerase-like protein